MKKYHFFWGGPFSNWCPATFVYKGHKFNNSEQAFMWEKAMCFNDVDTAAEILLSNHPSVAKKLGRTVKNYDDTKWAEVRYQIMIDVNIAKFSQNEELKKELFSHSDFVEASPEDKIWGIGMREGEPGIEDPANWKGTNLLGKALDEVKIILQNGKVE